MLIGPDKNGSFIGGPLDVLCILHDEAKGRFHAAFFEEATMPGPVPEVSETKVVRLKSRMHHTIGSDTLEGALVHLEELAKQILLRPENVWREPKPWDGQQGIVWLVSNWLK